MGVVTMFVGLFAVLLFFRFIKFSGSRPYHPGLHPLTTSMSCFYSRNVFPAKRSWEPSVAFEIPQHKKKVIIKDTEMDSYTLTYEYAHTFELSMATGRELHACGSGYWRKEIFDTYK